MIHKIPDNIIDIDTSIVEQYMEEDAWEELQQIIKTFHMLHLVHRKQSEWMCTVCHPCTTEANMIECDECGRWFHW